MLSPPAPGSHSEPLEEADLEALQSAAVLLGGRTPAPADALERAIALLGRGKYDFRVVAVALQATAMLHPLTGAADATKALTRWLVERYDAFDSGGDPKKTRLVISTLGALLDEMRASVAAAITTGATRDALAERAEAGRRDYWDDLVGALEAAVRNRSMEGLAPRMRALRAAVEPILPADAPVESGDHAAVAAQPVESAPTAAHQREAPKARSETGSGAGLGGGEVTLSASARFFELTFKLGAFRTLLDRAEHEKAALIGLDVLKTLSEFDPTLYFPSLFADFFAGLAVLSAAIDEPPNTELPYWNALQRLYRVDLERFMSQPAGAVRKSTQRRDLDES
jgi:hypothetical protein